MVAKLCARSQGQPEPGVRSAAMISIRRAMAREGFTGGSLGCGGKDSGHRSKAGGWLRMTIFDSHKRYYGIFVLIQIEQVNRDSFRRSVGSLQPLPAACACGLQNIFARFTKPTCPDHRLSP